MAIEKAIFLFVYTLYICKQDLQNKLKIIESEINMLGLFKFSRSASAGGAISDCAKNLKELQKLKMTYPIEKEPTVALSLNLKA